MDALLYFLFWALILFLMMRFGCGAHVMGHGHGSTEPGDSGRGSGRDPKLRWIAPEKDRDPVCGTVVETATAKPSIHDGVVYYFCSRDCREQFEAAPSHYVTSAIPADTKDSSSEARTEGSHV